MSPKLLIEVNAFTGLPDPHETKLLSSMIAELLTEIERHDLIKKYDLLGFDVEVLAVERTLTEKLLGLAKHSYAEDNPATLGKHIRHFYDVAMILRKGDCREFLTTGSFIELMNSVVENDKTLFGKDDGPWLTRPLAEAPIFLKPEPIWKMVEIGYLSQLKEMVFDDDLPSNAEMLEVLTISAKAVANYDQVHFDWFEK